MEHVGFVRIFYILLRILLRIVIVGGMILMLTQVLMYLGIRSSPAPPKPEVQYGEFPFKLEYELNGELYVIEDTLIVEFDGFGMNVGVGKYRQWKSRLASGADLVLLLEVNDNKQIFYFPGPANYYMGDRLNGYDHTFPNASFIERERRITRRDILHDKDLLEQFGSAERRTIGEEELLTQYGIRLVNWEYTKPIINNFPEN